MRSEDHLRELLFNVRRLSEVAESDGRRREDEYKDVVGRLEEQNVLLEQIKLLLTGLHSRPQLTSDEVALTIHKIFDDVRHLRALGVEKVEIGNGNGNGREDDTASIKFSGNRVKMILTGKVTWKLAYQILKWAAVAAATGTSVGLLIKAIWQAVTGR